MGNHQSKRSRIRATRRVLKKSKNTYDVEGSNVDAPAEEGRVSVACQCSLDSQTYILTLEQQIRTLHGQILHLKNNTTSAIQMRHGIQLAGEAYPLKHRECLQEILKSRGDIQMSSGEQEEVDHCDLDDCKELDNMVIDGVQDLCTVMETKSEERDLSMMAQENELRHTTSEPETCPKEINRCINPRDSISLERIPTHTTNKLNNRSDRQIGGHQRSKSEENGFAPIPFSKRKNQSTPAVSVTLMTAFLLSSLRIERTDPEEQHMNNRRPTKTEPKGYTYKEHRLKPIDSDGKVSQTQ